MAIQGVEGGSRLHLREKPNYWLDRSIEENWKRRCVSQNIDNMMWR